MAKSFTESIVVELSKLLMPIKQLNSPQRVRRLFREIGFDITDLGDADPNLQQLITNLSPLVDIIVGQDGLAELISDLIDANTDEQTATALLALANKIPDVIDVIYTVGPDLENTINNIIPNIPPDAVETLAEKLSRRLMEYLVYLYFQNYYQRVYSIFHFLGIMETVQGAGDAYPIKTIQWSRIPQLFSDPMTLVDDVYQWNTGPDTFDGNKFLSRMEILLRAFMLHGGIYTQNDDIRAQFGRTDPEDNKEIRMPLYQTGVWSEDAAQNEHIEIDLNLCPIPSDGGKNAGLGLYPYLTADVNFQQEIADNWILGVGGSLDPQQAGLGIKLRAPHELELIDGLFTQSPVDSFNQQFNARLEVSLKRTSPADSLSYIFGSEDSSHLALKEATLKFAVGLQDGAEEILAELDIQEFTIAINPGSDADGFLQKVLSGINIKLFSDLTIGISNLDGFYFRGSGGLEVAIPIHEDLGPIHIDTLFIRIDIGDGFDITLAASFGLQLGPIQGSVEKIGLTIPLEIPDNGRGNLGPLQIDPPRFKPPIGAGLALDTGFIVGGGYLEIDTENERYAGILELKIGEIGLVAIGLIATRMPDGSKGFSLLINIGVTFSPPIQLSFGFVLAGVGGLLGYNRTMLTDVLREGLKNKTLDSILFPEDPIANASKIISDLRSVFPVTEGQFVIGPMIKLGWGSPPLISVDIGIFIEIPSPVRIVLLGQVAATFPSPDLIIVEIHIDVLGVIDFGKKELSIDASIYDSRIYQLVLNGDAALLLSWGDNPVFIVSLGGFHPRFSPPPSLTSMKRLSLSISQSSILQIYCWTYQALTSNSLQFGAGVEFYAGAAGASIEGGMSFDALIYFNPFSFSIDMAGHLVARYKGFTLAGVYLSLGLSGPSPWNARGTATFEILFWNISVDFNVTWGPSDNERLPAIDPWLGSAADDIMGLQEALSLDSSWGSRLPAYANMFEALKEIEEVETEEADPEQPPPPMRILMHPFSRLEIQQKVLPFNLHLDKLGNNPVRDHNDFRIESVVAHVGDSTLDLTIEPLLQDMSRGQYKKLNKIQRLTLPSFEKLQAGILAGSETVYFAQNKSKHTEPVFESILINPDLTSSQPDNPEKATAKWHDTKYQMRRNAIRQSGLVNAGKRKYATAKPSKVQIQQEGYYVVKTDDLSLVTFDQLANYDQSWPDNEGNLTRVKADELMDIYMQENPDKQVQVISAYEYEEAA